MLPLKSLTSVLKVLFFLMKPQKQRNTKSATSASTWVRISLAVSCFRICLFSTPLFPMAADRLASFRQRLQRSSEVASASVAIGGRQHNSKRALKHWRQVLDKAHMVEQLVGLEASVHSWLPQSGAPSVCGQLSQEQLEEHVKHAEVLTSMRGKTAPVKTAEECHHPGNRLNQGGNQHGGWVICMDCHSRWSLYKNTSTAAAKKKAAAAPSLASSAQEKFDAAKMEYAIRGKLEQEFHTEYVKSVNSMKEEMKMEQAQQHSWMQNANNSHLRRTSELEMTVQREEMKQEEIKEMAKAEMRQMQAKLHIQHKQLGIVELMKTEYASMALGMKYQESQGYHDSEMYEYAERQWENLEEAQAMEKVMQEIEADKASRARAHGFD